MFVPLVAEKDEYEEAEWKREGYRLIDRFFVTNDKEGNDLAPFFDFFLNKVAHNIITHPDEIKYQKLKKSSKAFAIVGSVKLGRTLLEYCGFRSKVETFEEWYVLNTREDDWLEEFKGKVELIRKSWRKRLELEQVEEKGKAAKEMANSDHKEKVLARIREQRSSNNN
jgi:hypothetical protein